MRAEFRPARDAVEVDGDVLSGQLAKRLPVPPSQNITAIVDRKFPLVKRHVGRRSCRQDGEVSSEILPWRQLYICRASSTRKSS